MLLYDGVCGFCNTFVQSIIKRDKRGTMRFAALQSDYGNLARERHPELQGVDSVILLERDENGAERAFVRSTAALRVAGYLGGGWRLLAIAYIVPSRVRDFFYNLFARYRYRLFGKHESCMLPAPETRSRFLDV